MRSLIKGAFVLTNIFYQDNYQSIIEALSNSAYRVIALQYLTWIIVGTIGLYRTLNAATINPLTRIDTNNDEKNTDCAVPAE